MNHEIWLLKHWPKKNHPNVNPIIYAIDKEYSEKEVINIINTNKKENYITTLAATDGYDTYQECLDMINNDTELKLLINQPIKLIYKEKTYYIPYIIPICIPKTKIFNLFFNMKPEEETKMTKELNDDPQSMATETLAERRPAKP